MKKHKKSHEVIIRLSCFLLGVLLTLSAVLVRDRLLSADIQKEGTAVEAQPQEEVPSPTPAVEVEEVIEFENQLDNELTIGDSHVEVAELEQYEEEATQKLQELKEQPVLEPDDTVNWTSQVIANMEGKPSKLNWKPFYSAVNSTINLSLAQMEQERSSYEETLATNAFDKKVIEDNNVDFSGVKVTVLGDSISAASNLDEELAKQYNWPKIMGDILGCEINNMSIGGSSVSSCATTDPMCERWSWIPMDSDIIIIFGGTNDSLFETREQFGVLDYDYRMNKDTFCGDLDRMLSAMKWQYRETLDDHYVRLIYINPPSTILNDGVVAVDPNRYVPQWEFAQAINEMAPNYGFDVIDLYNTNFLNSHDYKINSEFMLDGVHGNVAAYQILAEHIASQIIQMVQQED